MILSSFELVKKTVTSVHHDLKTLRRMQYTGFLHSLCSCEFTVPKKLSFAQGCEMKYNIESKNNSFDCCPFLLIELTSNTYFSVK